MSSWSGVHSWLEKANSRFKAVGFHDWVTLAATIAIAISTGIYTNYSHRQWQAMTEANVISNKTADAAISAAVTASNQLVLGARPWVKIKHSIANPLTFGVGGRASGKLVAMITVEDTLENVGQSVALDVFAWEDLIPMDLDHSLKTARKRQAEYCDANRHPNPGGLAGYGLFPHDPLIQRSTVGPTMDTVKDFTTHEGPENRQEGTVSFVLVGCVFYRSSFEAASGPTHQTRFMYFLGREFNGGIGTALTPHGTATGLSLFPVPDGSTVD